MYVIKPENKRSQRLEVVKDMRVLLHYPNDSIFRATWTGDTHEETDIVPVWVGPGLGLAVGPGHH